MVSLDVHPSKHRKWVQTEGDNTSVWLTGWGRTSDEAVEGSAFADWIIENLSNQPFKHVISAVDGNFAVAIEADDRVLLGTDRTRSIPLFYREEGDRLVVSDDIREVVSPSQTLDWESAVEYAAAGLVTGQHTIYEDSTALRAGDVVEASTEGSSMQERYYEYNCQYDASDSISDLCAEFHEILGTVFERVVEELDGRQVVIPLSAGYDSRLVAATFRRLGYENVTCFSYGTAENFEIRKSREVAEDLGYDWEQVVYTAETWKQLLDSDEMREYWAFGATGVSTPHINDYPAVRELRDRSAIDDTAVFVPGHTGDFLCGSHLKYLFDPRYYDDPTDLTGAMLKKHYALWESLLDESHVRSIVTERMEELFRGLDNDSDEDRARCLEYWEWNERQSKFIINAVRVYEYFDFDWRIPLWSRPIMDFWTRIPIDAKVNKYLYKKYLSSYDPGGVFSDVTPKPWNRDQVVQEHETRLKTKLRDRLEGTPLERLLQHRKHAHDYRDHPLGIASYYGPVEYVLKQPSKRHHEALLLRDVMETLYGVSIPEDVRNRSVFAPSLE